MYILMASARVFMGGPQEEGLTDCQKGSDWLNRLLEKLPTVVQEMILKLTAVSDDVLPTAPAK